MNDFDNVAIGSDLKTVGEFKRFLEVNKISDDTPLWLGDTIIEGGLDYYTRPRKYDVNAYMDQQTFGLALPKEQQRTQWGLVIY